MLKWVLFETTMFDSADNVEQTRKDLCWLLEGLTQRNQDFIKTRPATPRLYKSGVVYQNPAQFDGECEEVKILKAALGSKARDYKVARVLDLIQDVLGGERFRDIGRILENDGGDCDNLACWRAAELRQAGIPARPYMTHRDRPDGGTTYHALVLWPPIPGVPYVTSEDPSLLLGMGGRDRSADRVEEIRKNAERCEHLMKAGGYYSGFNASLEDVLGLRRTPRADIAPVIADLERLFGAKKRAA